MRLTKSQIELYKLALYDLDSFRCQLIEDKIETPIDVVETVYNDDKTLLEFGITMLTKLFFNA